jgi:hypothetical protein
VSILRCSLHGLLNYFLTGHELRPCLEINPICATPDLV